MPAVEVDFLTYKAIVALRRSEAMSEGDVIRELLLAASDKHRPAKSESSDQAESAGSPGEHDVWWHKGVTFPVGLALEHVFRGGRTAKAVIVFGGIEYEGRRYSSLSRAGVEAAGYQVDGWSFWNFRDDRGSLQPVKTKRTA